MATNAHPPKGPKLTRHLRPPTQDEAAPGNAHVHQQRLKQFHERDNPDLSQRVTHGRAPLWKPRP